MADVAWPISKKPSDIKEKIITNRRRNDFANGQPLVMRNFTRTRKKFSLTWDESGYHALTNADKSALENLFYENHASSILWHHPWTGNSYTVIFTDDELDFKLIYPEVPGYEGYWSVIINLEEL